MKTPTAEPKTPNRAYSDDLSTWLTVLFGVFVLVKLGVVISRHMPLP